MRLDYEREGTLQRTPGRYKWPAVVAFGLLMAAVVYLFYFWAAGIFNEFE